MTPSHVLDDAPPTPEQIELVNRVFRPAPKPAARPARSTA